MHTINGSPEYKTIQEKVIGKFPDMEFFKEGPAGKPTTNLIGKDKKTRNYCKVFFTEAGKLAGVQEIELITLFNQYAQEYSLSFSGPTIIESSKEDLVYMLMRDIEATDKKMIQFAHSTPNDLIKLYDEYKTTFQGFEQYTDGLVSHGNGSRDIITEDIDRVYDMQKSRLLNRIEKGNSFVSEVIHSSPKKIQDYYDLLRTNIQDYEFEYGFGRFWTGHVFSDGLFHQLIDFDNVGYHPIGSDVLGIIRSTVLLSVEKYDSYELRKRDFSSRYNYLLQSTENKPMIDFLLFQKLIGTIYMDFGNLMLTEPHNREKIVALGQDLEKNAKKGIERNYRLLKEIYPGVDSENS